MLQGNIDISFRVKGHKGAHKILLPSFFTYLCYVKVLARSTLRVSAENGAGILRLVRICVFFPSPLLHHTSRISPLPPFRA